MGFKELEALDQEDVKLAHRIERADIATFSQVVKTIYRAEYGHEDDAEALALLTEWVKRLG